MRFTVFSENEKPRGFILNPYRRMLSIKKRFKQKTTTARSEVKAGSAKDLSLLPIEVLFQIFPYLDRPSRTALVLTCSQILSAFISYCNLDIYKEVSSSTFIDRFGSSIYEDFETIPGILKWISHDGNVVFENLKLGDPDFKPSRFTDVDFDSWNGVVEMEGHKYDNYIAHKLHETSIIQSYLDRWLRKYGFEDKMIFCNACCRSIDVSLTVDDLDGSGVWTCGSCMYKNYYYFMPRIPHVYRLYNRENDGIIRTALQKSRTVLKLKTVGRGENPVS